jgi:RNA polymerase sigma-70 factor (ECF subfamily)
MQRWEVFRIRRAVGELPEKQRLVFVMSHFADMRYAEIAELVGIPEGTVKSRMATAVRALRGKLGEREIGDRSHRKGDER